MARKRKRGKLILPSGLTPKPTAKPSNQHPKTSLLVKGKEMMRLSSKSKRMSNTIKMTKV